MPLEAYPIREALRRASRNRQNLPQPREGGAVAKTHDLLCNPSFKISKAAHIFTVGSCFARHVEAALGEFGFTLPALKIPAEALGLVGKDTGALNKYTPPSITNEIRWAFEDSPVAPIERALIPFGDGYWDGQLHVRAHELPDYETALKRRLAVNAAYRALATCDVAIITFGLVETWRDLETGLYLNETPPRGLMRSDRFELVLLSFQDCLDEARYTLNKLFEINADANVIVTVSPVSLGATFSSDPLIVRNSYSKSVLRAMVEHLRQEFPRIDYYPSYERIMYADRRTAFEQDEVHVTASIVNHTMVSMLEAYLDTDITEFTEGAGRLWWKAVFERDGEKALALYRAHTKRVQKRLRKFPALKAEFDMLVGGDSYEMEPAE
ncbi:MAG TPA: GSCFA domain-containing protein [Rhizomicrobium sp.]|nr:GSCFA domain-containing protein [Rhizomicrobium sp.]